MLFPYPKMRSRILAYLFLRRLDMTPEKILEVVRRYKADFERQGSGKLAFPHSEFLPSMELGDAHCNQMLDKIEQYVAENRIEKAFRWLGFVQGYLWATRVYTIEELANHYRPTEAHDQPSSSSP